MPDFCRFLIKLCAAVCFWQWEDAYHLVRRQVDGVTPKETQPIGFKTD